MLYILVRVDITVVAAVDNQLTQVASKPAHHSLIVSQKLMEQQQVMLKT